VGQDLPEPIVARVNDQFGAAMSGVSVDFAVTIGGGSVSTASAVTDASGQVSANWRLGTKSGPQRATATVSDTGVRTAFSTTGLADAPADLIEVSGNNQVAPRNEAVGAPLVVRVDDQYGNRVPGVSVAFAVQMGGGSLNPGSVDTDVNGEAATAWTLGDPEGQQTVEVTAAALPAASILFQAQSVNFNVFSISPDTLVEGQTLTITGEGFDPNNLGNNVVTIDGITAAVTAATTTQLTVTVPQFDCRPTRVVGVTLGLGGFTLPPLDRPLRPAEFVSLAVGDAGLLLDPATFCLQFEAFPAGGDAYIVGVGATAETPPGAMAITMTGTAGQRPSGSPSGTQDPAPLPARSAGRPRTLPIQDVASLEEKRAHLTAELELRQREREFLFERRASLMKPPVRAPGAVAEVPSVGDTLRFRVPNIGLDANSCTEFTEITTVVRAVGDAGIFVSDTANPTADALTDADIEAARDTFDIHIFDVDTLYFGPTVDLDMNGHVLVVLTIQVNKMREGRVAGFVSAADLFERSPSGCVSSDGGEIFYSHVPDPDDEAGTGPQSKQSVLNQMSSLIAHEFAHVIQLERRIIELQATALPASWELEGQATLAEEVVAHSIFGNGPGQDLGGSVVLEEPTASWYQPSFVQLAFYYGWGPVEDDADRRNANAPELCTLFGNRFINGPPDVACDPFWFYGASWSFQRQILDRFGPRHPGGEAGLARNWIDANPSLEGVQNVEALLGMEFDSLFAAWAAMHWVDGRVAGINPSFQTTSWDLFDIFQGVREAARLKPQERQFADFEHSASIMAGSTLYTRLSAAGARPAFSLRVTASTGAPLSGVLQPQLWIVREQ
jgi:hypothetical protein